MILYHIADISTALRQLEEIVGTHGRQISQTIVYPLQVASAKDTLPFFAKTWRKRQQPQIEIIQPKHHQALIQYLQKRGICRKTAAPYVKEIYYLLKGKKYFALAFPNLSGGYEVRNPYFKGVIGKKDISLLVKGKRNIPLKAGIIRNRTLDRTKLPRGGLP